MKTIEEIQTQLDEIQKDLNVIKSQPSQDENKIKTTILVGGLKFALHNLGTDMDNPYGKLYSWDEAMEACPKGWRLPTQDEWSKFIENTTHEWIEDKEAINGKKFTDKITGKSIFLPAMGWDNFIERKYNNYVGLYGWYWSSTHNTTFPPYLYNLCFYYNGYVGTSGNTNHNLNFSVRYIQD